MVSLSKSLDSTGVQAFVQVLNTGLYLAIGRTAGALVSATAAKIADVKATQEQTYAASVSAAGEVRRAQAVKAEAVAELDRARQAVASARAQVAADRERQASEISRLRAVQASLVAERELEGQRLKAQITEIGRQQSVARMAELRLAETAIIKQLQAAEAQLTATTVAGSQAITAALNQQYAATERTAAATLQLNATQAASTAAMGRWFAASTALGAGLNALRTAGAGDSQDCCWMAGADHLAGDGSLVLRRFRGQGREQCWSCGQCFRGCLHAHPSGRSVDDSRGPFRAQL
ncbi:tail tape measure protein [Pseudomonas aeruginosa]|nr:tail tape measure protein [Pseudomonas aeruginosa]